MLETQPLGSNDHAVGEPPSSLFTQFHRTRPLPPRLRLASFDRPPFGGLRRVKRFRSTHIVYVIQSCVSFADHPLPAIGNVSRQDRSGTIAASFLFSASIYALHQIVIYTTFKQGHLDYSSRRLRDPEWLSSGRNVVETVLVFRSWRRWESSLTSLGRSRLFRAPHLPCTASGQCCGGEWDGVHRHVLMHPPHSALQRCPDAVHG